MRRAECREARLCDQLHEPQCALPDDGAGRRLNHVLELPAKSAPRRRLSERMEGDRPGLGSLVATRRRARSLPNAVVLGRGPSLPQTTIAGSIVEQGWHDDALQPSESGSDLDKLRARNDLLEQKLVMVADELNHQRECDRQTRLALNQQLDLIASRSASLQAELSATIALVGRRRPPALMNPIPQHSRERRRSKPLPASIRAPSSWPKPRSN